MLLLGGSRCHVFVYRCSQWKVLMGLFVLCCDLILFALLFVICYLLLIVVTLVSSLFCVVNLIPLGLLFVTLAN